VNQTTTPTPTAEETELNRLEIERQRAAQPGVLDVQQRGLDLSSQTLGAFQGGEVPTAGPLAQLFGGISSEAIGQQAAELARQSGSQFQSLGIAESGTAFRETAEDIAGNILFPAEQFNIGTLQNLLNQAFGGQAQVQAPIQAGASQLGARLAGLRPVTTQGTTATQFTQPNPFLQSFQTQLGKTLGGGGLSFGVTR